PQWNRDIEGQGHIREAAWAVSRRREEIGRATVFDQQEGAFELSHDLRLTVVPTERARPGLGVFRQLPMQSVFHARLASRVLLADDLARHVLGDHLVALRSLPDERVLDLSKPVG